VHNLLGQFVIYLSVDAVVVLTARQSKSIVQYSHSISIPLASNPTLVGLWKVAHKPACDCFVLITGMWGRGVSGGRWRHNGNLKLQIAGWRQFRGVFLFSWVWWCFFNLGCGFCCFRSWWVPGCCSSKSEILKRNKRLWLLHYVICKHN
jgi:hypothetical protein